MPVEEKLAMPNSSNISSPIVLISPGRSGTTLMSNVFAWRDDCSSCGETADLIFSLWDTAQRSLAHITPEDKRATSAPLDERAGRFVQQGILALLADEKPLWFQKPIGVPPVFTPYLFDVASWDECARKYWKVMRFSFPQARIFTVLRHPCDIVFSYKQRFDEDEEEIWASLGFLSFLIQHPDSMVGHAVKYEDMIANAGAAVQSLCTYLDIPHRPGVLKAFDLVHSINSARTSSSQSGFTWQDQWGDLNLDCARDEYVAPIMSLHRKFNADIADFPRPPSSDDATMRSPGMVVATRPREANVASDHRERELAAREAFLDMRWEERAARLEAELHDAYLRLENELQDGFTALQTEFDSASQEMKAAFHSAYLHMESGMRELTALRRNPAVRFLKRIGLLQTASQCGSRKKR